MSEKSNFHSEAPGCSVCGTERIFREGKCAKCLVESEYDDMGSEFDKQDGKAPREDIHIHSAGLKQNIDRGMKKIAKVKPVKIKINIKK